MLFFRKKPSTKDSLSLFERLSRKVSVDFTEDALQLLPLLLRHRDSFLGRLPLVVRVLVVLPDVQILGPLEGRHFHSPSTPDAHPDLVCKVALLLSVLLARSLSFGRRFSRFRFLSLRAKGSGRMATKASLTRSVVGSVLLDIWIVVCVGKGANIQSFKRKRQKQSSRSIKRLLAA